MGSKTKLSNGSLGYCTIVSANYLAHARTLVDSYFRHNSEGTFFVLVLDPSDATPIKSSDHCHYVPLSNLASMFPIIQGLAFRYSPLELACALKPFFIEYLFQKYQQKRVGYFDADIWITGNVDSLIHQKAETSLWVTPHLLDPQSDLQDGLMPDDFAILQSGVFNLGFIGVSDCTEGRKFLNWWQKKVARDCRKAPQSGQFLDQRWGDFLPAFFAGSEILRDPGCNVAYWNLQERKIQKIEDRYFINDQPMRFFHFSGFNWKQPSILSSHQSRFSLQHNPVWKQLFDEYLNALERNEVEEFSEIPYGWNHFDNEFEIAPIIRDVYSKVFLSSTQFRNPFDTSLKEGFFNWLITPFPDYVPPLILEMRSRRQDVMTSFPYPGSFDSQVGLLEWASTCGWKEFGLDDVWAKLFRLAEVAARGKKRMEDGQRVQISYTRSAEPPCGFGVNFACQIGLGGQQDDLVQSISSCLRATGIPSVTNRLRLSQTPGPADLLEPNSEVNPFSINLIHLSPQDLEAFAGSRGRQYFQSRYNIGYWTWDFPEFPVRLHKWFDWFDEIWVPSSFAQKAISQYATVPVACVPFSVEALPEFLTENSAGTSEGSGQKFYFYSEIELGPNFPLSNVEGLIEAFRFAFAGQDAVRLLLGLIPYQGDTAQVARLRNLSKGGSIEFVEVPSNFQNERVWSQMNCYVSLSRSDSVGNSLLRAMAKGIPVLSTSYSGGLDFLNESNSFLIGWQAARNPRPFGAYPAGGVWAEADRDATVEALKEAYGNRSLRGRRAREAWLYVSQKHSIKNVSQIFSQRLKNVSKRPPRFV